MTKDRKGCDPQLLPRGGIPNSEWGADELRECARAQH